MYCSYCVAVIYLIVIGDDVGSVLHYNSDPH